MDSDRAAIESMSANATDFNESLDVAHGHCEEDCELFLGQPLQLANLTRGQSFDGLLCGKGHSQDRRKAIRS